MKAKAKFKSTQPEGADEPYHHPILEEQMIIRFPPDIAAKLLSQIDDQNFTDFDITFTDAHHATVKIFGETLNAVLVSLPTIVETHRTVDGSHLYKSADIGEMLIVYQQNSHPQGVRSDFTYDDGLTPPTQDIVARRDARQQAARDAQSGDDNGPSIDGIDYLEIAEIQLSKLLSKDGNAKTIYRHEFLEEPDVDAAMLEKTLVQKYGDKYKGYSGTEVAEETPETESQIPIPSSIASEVIRSAGSEEKEESGEEGGEAGESVEEDHSEEKSSEEKAETEKSGEEEEVNIDFSMSESDHESKESPSASAAAASATPPSTSTISKSSSQEKSGADESKDVSSAVGSDGGSDEEEEEEDQTEELQQQMRIIEANISTSERELQTEKNELLRERKIEKIRTLKNKLDQIKKDLADKGS